MPNTETRSEKLDLRLNPSAKRALQVAAIALHRSVSEFVLESALARAEETLPDRQRFGLSAEQWEAFQAASPRFIGFDPSHRFLYATNEQSDTIVAFRVDSATGGLTPTGQVVQNASPVTVALVKA